MMEVCEVIDKWPYNTSSVAMEHCVNDEHEDSTRKDLAEKNDTKENNEVRSISTKTESKDEIHKYITDNYSEKYLDYK